MDITPHPSPNFDGRAGGIAPDMVVLHYTAMETAKAALARLVAPEFNLSTHYLIAESGKVFQLVEEKMRAWHAGAGCWGTVVDVNSHAIGIELANTGTAPFSEAQMRTLERLLASLMHRWSIPPERIIGHSDMAPMRKSDPGMRFDWCRLARSGLSVWPNTSKPRTPDKTSFQIALHRFGYTSDIGFDPLLTAFRLRFRPWHSGELDPVDMALAADLAKRFPVDQSPFCP